MLFLRAILWFLLQFPFIKASEYDTNLESEYDKTQRDLHIHIRADQQYDLGISRFWKKKKGIRMSVLYSYLFFIN